MMAAVNSNEYFGMRGEGRGTKRGVIFITQSYSPTILLGKKYNLTVILSERLKSLATSGTKYFAVAVVKKSSSLKFSSLRVGI